MPRTRDTIGPVGRVAAVIALACSLARGDAPPATLPYVRPPPAVLDLPATPGDHKLKFTTTIAGRPVTLSYLLHLPSVAPVPGDRRRPAMMVFFHGIGEVGTDLAGVYALGPMTMFRPGPAGRRWATRARWPSCARSARRGASSAATTSSTGPAPSWSTPSPTAASSTPTGCTPRA